MENLFINFHWETLYKANIKCSLLHAQITMGLLSMICTELNMRFEYLQFMRLAFFP